MKLLFHLLLLVLIVATCFTCEAVTAPSQVVKREAMRQCVMWEGKLMCPGLDSWRIIPLLSAIATITT
uniref:Uncharacterized protein n=1 Tax=Anopheles coluzzii TaxID=1518534 RepID=A0A6E8VZF4_ANOCL